VSSEQRAVSREQRAVSREQRAESREQRAVSSEEGRKILPPCLSMSSLRVISGEFSIKVKSLV